MSALLIDIGDLTEFQAEKAVEELRRIIAGYEKAGQLKVLRDEITPAEVEAKMLPSRLALRICSAVSLAFAEPAEPARPAPKPAAQKPASAPEPDGEPIPLCCLCDSPGLSSGRIGAYLCSNPACPRHQVPLARRVFVGFEEQAQKTRQNGPSLRPDETRPHAD